MLSERRYAPLPQGPTQDINIPGTSCLAIVMLPLRIIVVALGFTLMYPLLVVFAILRALYLRIVKGRPSQILKYGTYGEKHVAGGNYPCQQLYKEPLDEARFRKALIELAAEDGIEEKDIDIKFYDEKPNDWPTTSAFDVDHFIESLKRPKNRGSMHYVFYLMFAKQAVIQCHVWNNDPGKPTVMYWGGSAYKWDGSSNFNFVKELMNRYVGNPPNKVFQKPEITAKAAGKFDQGSFLLFLLKLPTNTAKNVWTFWWFAVRSAKWAGGNGFGPRITALNFSKEDSAKLYHGAKTVGLTPFSAFSYALVKACNEILKQKPLAFTQQSSLQTRHFPLQSDVQTRDLVGDWLVGPVQEVPDNFGYEEAKKMYKELQTELDEIGPCTRRAIWAKAYALINSGAAMFQFLPCFNEWHHPTSRIIFMNNYGIRTTPPGSPFHTWNWNAPMWLGFNTINVDGCTTTLMGSSFWGLEIVEALRDNVEATLRNEFMAKAPANVGTVPTYKPNSGSPV